MKVYIVCGYYDCEGYDDPLGAWEDKEQALEAAKELDEASDNGYCLVEVFEVELGVAGSVVSVGGGW